MLYILHNSEQDTLINSVLQHISEVTYELLIYPLDNKKSFTEEDIIVTYLCDEDLKSFIHLAAKNSWQIGILPHPDNNLTLKGLGLETDLKKSLSEILDPEKCQKLDLLYYNETPVLQSVNIGNAFLLSEEEEKNKNFLSEALQFIKNIKKITSLIHKPFQLSIDGNRIIHTSALGLIAVEHSSNSVVSKRLIPETAVNDGQFNVLIVSPQSVFELLLFFLRSLIPWRKNIRQLPSFIGQVRTSNLKIETTSEEEFSVDGKQQKAANIDLKIAPEALQLAQESIYTSEKTTQEVNRSLKIEQLPKGETREGLTKYKLPLIPRATPEDFKELFTLLRKNAVVSTPFLVMMILSTLIATFGLFGDSSPVIIGAMILAPIITPIVSFSMGMVRYDLNLLKNGVITILAGTLVSLLFAALVSFIIPLKILTSEIGARLAPNLLDMGIAVASGIAAAYAHAKSGIAKSLAGVAIAVALVPPLSVAGIGIGWWDWEVFSGAILLYLTNLSGIILFAGLTFLLLGFAPFKTAKMGLVYTFLMTLLVMVPLSLSFNQIMEEARITKELEGAVFNEVVLRDVKVRFGSEFMISVKLVGPEAINSEEMMEIKKKIEEKIGHPIILEVLSAVEF